MTASSGAPRVLPSGTVTFLFTDIEGSTKLLHELGNAAYADALGKHRRILREAFVAHGGVEVDTQGDAFFVAFPTAAGALASVNQAKEGLAGGPIGLRVGMHTGTPFVTAEGYIGPDVHRAARIAAAGHGGQVLVSRETRQLLDGKFLDLGEHRLKDFSAPVWLFQLGAASFPPLKTVSNTNLPRPASEFIGRETEVGDVVALIKGGARFVTLTGPGGTGKTRLGIETASRLVGSMRSGVFWIGAAALRDPALVTEAIGQTLGAKGSLADDIAEREMLLVIDNLEQVASVAPRLAELVERCPNLRLLVTSRERLRVRGEREYPVPTLADEEAMALFCARAGLEQDAAIRELCRALDNLPLAIELAASRASVLSPSQILDRLSARLDLLKGGRDADPRQLTLRATIDWSHDLLSQDERRLFARMSVFAGGATLESVEAVADADVDTLQSLVDKSLVRQTDARFWMLESIRGYATERLEESNESAELRRRHGGHYLDLAEELSAEMEAGEPEEGRVAELEMEIDNLRSAAAFGLEAGDVDLVRRITAALTMYWVVRGLHAEARAWLERALALHEAGDETRRRLLSALGTISYAQGDHAAAVAAADAAAALATELGGATDEIVALREEAFAALRRGDYEHAEELFRRRLGLAIAVGNGVGTSSCRLNLASIANRTDRHERAEALLAENLPFVRSRGQVRCEANTLAMMVETATHIGRAGNAADEALLAATLAFQIRDNPLTVYCLELLALSFAERGDADRAGTLLGATEALRETMDLVADDEEAAIRARAHRALRADRGDVAEAWERGRRLDLPAAIEVAKATGVLQPA